MGTFGFHLSILLLSIALVVAPPPKRQEAEAQQQQEAHHQQQQQNQQENGESKPFYQFAYSKYLENVVKILESHPKFAEKLKTMSQDDIKAGKVADHMDVLESEVFDELTKHKLAEIERLREEIQKQMEKEGGAHNIRVPEHLDVNDLQKFGPEDLRKLITKTVADMEEMDKTRREEFKEYELKKKAEEEHKLAQMSPEERAKVEKEIEESKKRHNEHEKLNHPGGREQLEEVWEDKDGMDKDSFEPKAFFALHDLNGDGYWNEEELEALFQIELDKIYNETNPDDDPKERIEEMYRMREHVVKQMDTNNDRLISLSEFLNDNEAQDPNKKEPEWQDIAQQQIYTDEELKKFEEEYAKKQGWGDHAYESTTTQTLGRAPELHEANAVHQQGQVNQQQQYPQPGQIHNQVPQQPGQQVPQQPGGQQQYQQPVQGQPQYQQQGQPQQQQQYQQQQPVQGQQQQFQQQQPVQGQLQYQQQPVQGQQQVYQQQVPQGQQVPVQGQPQYQQQPVQGQQQVYQQQGQAVPVQPQANQQQFQQPQVPQGGPPKIPKAVDPVYGI